METSDLTGLQYTPRQITGKRGEVRKNFIAQFPRINGGEINRISSEDLELWFRHARDSQGGQTLSRLKS